MLPRDVEASQINLNSIYLGRSLCRGQEEVISIGSGWHSISNFAMNIKNHNCFLFSFIFISFSFAKIYADRNEHVIYKKCYTNYWISFVYVCAHLIGS